MKELEESVKMFENVSSKSRFWKQCLQLAKAQPELSAEEVEVKAVLVELGLRPK